MRYNWGMEKSLPAEKDEKVNTLIDDAKEALKNGIDAAKKAFKEATK